jgi:hypothetical protein
MSDRPQVQWEERPFIALPEFAWFGIHVPSGLAAISQIARTREIYGNGSYFAILNFHWQETGVSPDRQTILFSKSVTNGGNLMMIENFQ